MPCCTGVSSTGWLFKLVVAEIVHLDLSHANAGPLVGFWWCEWLLVVPQGPVGAGTSMGQDWEYPGGSSPAFT